MNDRRRVVTRRDFVRGGAGAAVGVSLFGVGARDVRAREARPATVVLVRDRLAFTAGHDVDEVVLREMLARAVIRVTGAPTARDAWRALINPSEVVGLVPTSHLNPTHGEIVAAVRAAVREAGVAPDRIRIAQGGPENAEACTALISLPALKAHWLTGIGTVLKNYITFSGNPSRYHDENNDRLGEIWLLPHVKGKTRLVLVDALRPLCDKGPQPDPRYMWEYRGLIAGTDPVAVEAVSLRILTAKREALRGEPWPLSPPPLCVAMADRRYALGTCRPDEITIDRVGWAEEALI